MAITARKQVFISDLSDKDFTCTAGQLRVKDDVFVNPESGNAPVAGATPDTVPTDPSDNAVVIEIWDDLVRYWTFDAGAGTWNLDDEVERGGEVNTASNVGTDGEGPFKQKTGVDLEFYNIAPEDAKITVTLNGDDIDIGLGTVAINDLNDVNAASTEGHLLYFNGTTWDDLDIGAAGDMLVVNDAGTALEPMDESTPLDCASIGTH